MPSRALLLALVLFGGCQPTAARRGATVLFASGADLQSMNPLVTLHPLARQVQRYVLLTTLARYDSALVPEPYLARGWVWSDDRRSLVLHLVTGLRWADGVLTSARDVRWTLEAARDPVVGYPRAAELAGRIGDGLVGSARVGARTPAGALTSGDRWSDMIPACRCGCCT